jgi:hypothetical protein
VGYFQWAPLRNQPSPLSPRPDRVVQNRSSVQKKKARPPRPPPSAAGPRAPGSTGGGSHRRRRHADLDRRCHDPLATPPSTAAATPASSGASFDPTRSAALTCAGASHRQRKGCRPAPLKRRRLPSAPSADRRRAPMEGNGFDPRSHEESSYAGANSKSSQPPPTGPVHGRAAPTALDLNLRAPGEGFPAPGQYQNILQGDDFELFDGSGRYSGLPPLRAPRSIGVPDQRVEGWDGRASRTTQSACHLNFGQSEQC